MGCRMRWRSLSWQHGFKTVDPPRCACQAEAWWVLLGVVYQLILSWLSLSPACSSQFPPPCERLRIGSRRIFSGSCLGPPSPAIRGWWLGRHPVQVCCGSLNIYQTLVIPISAGYNATGGAVKSNRNRCQSTVGRHAPCNMGIMYRPCIPAHSRGCQRFRYRAQPDRCRHLAYDRPIPRFLCGHFC